MVAVAVIISLLYWLQQIYLILPAYFARIERKLLFHDVKIHDTLIILAYEMQEHPKKIFIEIICLLEYCITTLRLLVSDLVTLVFRIKDKFVKRKLRIAQIWSSSRREK